MSLPTTDTGKDEVCGVLGEGCQPLYVSPSSCVSFYWGSTRRGSGDSALQRGGSGVKMHFAVSLHPFGFAGGLPCGSHHGICALSRRCPHGAIPRFPTLPSHPSVSPIPPFLSSVSVTQVFRVIVLNWLNYFHLYVHTALQFANTFIFTFIFL